MCQGESGIESLSKQPVLAILNANNATQSQQEESFSSYIYIHMHAYVCVCSHIKSHKTNSVRIFFKSITITNPILFKCLHMTSIHCASVNSFYSLEAVTRILHVYFFAHFSKNRAVRTLNHSCLSIQKQRFVDGRDLCVI